MAVILAVHRLGTQPPALIVIRPRLPLQNRLPRTSDNERAAGRKSDDIRGIVMADGDGYTFVVPFKNHVVHQ